MNWLNFSSLDLCIRSRLTPLRRVGFLRWGVFRFVLRTRLALPIIRISVEVVALGKIPLLSRLFLTISWIIFQRSLILLLTLQVLILGLPIWVTNLVVVLQDRLRFPLVFFVPNVVLTILKKGSFNLLLNLTVSFLYFYQLVTLIHSLIVTN